MTTAEIEKLSTAKPILFNSDMVRAILDGRKSVTRRVVKAKPPYSQKQLNERENYRSEKDVAELAKNGRRASVGFWKSWDGYVPHKECAYKVGDILYVRETWLKADDGYYYKTDIKVPSESEDLRKAYGYKWRPSIHMPKEAARIFLKVTNVRAERLQDMDVANCVREGVDFGGVAWTVNAKPAFIKLWNSTIKKQDLDRYGWEANPWVWVIEFEKVTP